MNVYNQDAVKDVADSLGINNLNDEVAKTLTQDVEYRIHAIIQEANKFMRHSKRTTMRTSDISHALRILNVEPLYGFTSNSPVKYREALLAPGQPPLFYVDDEEVEFEKIINAPLPKVPREVTYTAHWLAIEGVQPAIPQNPPPTETKIEANTQEASSTGPSVNVQPLVKHVLSKELLLYFERIGKAALDETNETLQTAAIASLRNDPGLHQLLPYFIQFIAEKVTHNLKSLSVLNIMMQMSWALLDNPNLFIEPYIHQLMPAILTCLVAKRLGGVDGSTTTSHPSEPPAHYALRDLSASILGLLCERHGDAYHTLRPRVTKTLLKAYLDNKKPLTTHYGAIVGLAQLGREVVRILVLPNAGTYEKILVPELASADRARVQEAQMCLDALKRALDQIRTEPLPPAGTADETLMKSDEEIRGILVTRVGGLLADHVMAHQSADQTILKILLST
ncbi:Transcription initiation factor TFIID subunit 6 [Taphrina deformans PYCC 5710]|uniref:TBP-associated factor 6 n=1 Tax=Taphrina deformans (strain PYCC 5710 / ATCC 11124 / CBS 356.35 / IMI 108563 / JCM 9778 / NBRC 8474) TaxID=1097556 RepID=R4XAR3_TAPDE|nr:Transcription initiation factor TFIID subunit 6 [Taphrina deformans PYCC 5710]|eukprot:CCG82609.1 Transcription initiation factor TFIID subunit 6 [Taphrina deformans PYCC 5710]